MSLSATDIRNLAFTALAILIGAALVPGLSFLGVPLAASGLAWIAYRHGYVASVVAAVLATSAVALVSGLPMTALYVGPALLASGPGAALALTRWPAVLVVVALTLALLITFLAADTAFAWTMGRTLVAQHAADAATLRKAVEKPAPAPPGTDPVIAARAEKTMRQLAGDVERLWAVMWPTMYLYLAGLVAVLSVPLITRAARAAGRAVNTLPKLPELDVSPHFAWPIVAGLALLAAAVYLKQSGGWMQNGGLNLLLAVRPILFFQGLGCFAALYRKAQLRLPGKVFGFTFLVFSELIVPSVSIVGLADLFANFRRLPRQVGELPAARV